MGVVIQGRRVSSPVWFPDITGLTLHSVEDRGVPNKERVTIVANEDIETTDFGLLIGMQQHDGSAVPIKDSMLWLGGGFMRKGDWLFVYSGPGVARTDPLSPTTNLISVYWGKTRTAFYAPDLVPILFRVGQVSVLPLPQKPQSLPQYGEAMQRLIDSFEKNKTIDTSGKTS